MANKRIIKKIRGMFKPIPKAKVRKKDPYKGVPKYYPAGEPIPPRLRRMLFTELKRIRKLKRVT